jgi:hypothetical protein
MVPAVRIMGIEEIVSIDERDTPSPFGRGLGRGPE